MPRRKLVALIIAVAIALLATTVALAAAIQIDNFNTGTLSISVENTAPQTSSGIDTSGGLGGDREAVLTWVDGNGSAQVNIDRFDTNRLNFNQDNGVRSRVVLRWDGSDSDPIVNNQGLNVDLTDGNTNDGFDFEVVNDDNLAITRFRVYSGAANWSQYTLNLPGGINFPAHVDFFVPFGPGNGWTIGNGSGANFASVTSIEVEIDGTVIAGADVAIDFFEVDNFREYGDLPDTAQGGLYSTAIVNAFQIPQGLRLGSDVDLDPVAQPNISAGTTTAGDDNAATLGEVDDEDGVTPTAGRNWAAGVGGGSVNFSIAGCTTAPATPCRLNAWIDWNNDGDFADTREQIFTDYAINYNGPYIVTFDVPDGQLFERSFYARFRVCPTTGQCFTPDASNVVNGEIEDYRWGFGPLAVTLESLQAQPTTSPVVLVALVGVSAAALIGVVYLIRRRKIA